MSDNEHSTAPLGDSEVPCVENAVSDAVPELGQRSKYDAEVPTIVRGEQSGYVLDQQPGWSKSVSDAGELMEQAASGSGESGAFSCDGEVLAGEAAGEEIKTGIFDPLGLSSAFATSSARQFSSMPSGVNVRVGSYSTNVVVDGGPGPVSCEHIAPPGVEFGEEGVREASAGEAEVYAAYTREQRAGDHRSTHTSR
jgi:hypothetical protein